MTIDRCWTMYSAFLRLDQTRWSFTTNYVCCFCEPSTAWLTDFNYLLTTRAELSWALKLLMVVFLKNQRESIMILILRNSFCFISIVVRCLVRSELLMMVLEPPSSTPLLRPFWATRLYKQQQRGYSSKRAFGQCLAKPRLSSGEHSGRSERTESNFRS